MNISYSYGYNYIFQIKNQFSKKTLHKIAQKAPNEKFTILNKVVLKNQGHHIIFQKK